MYIKLADLNKMGDRYIRRDIDGGILTDKFEIDKYRKQQYLDVVDNLLLGSYNEFGEYEIENEMVEELVKAPKVIESNYENLLFVRTLFPINAFSVINFVVKVTNTDQKGYKTAILELLEPIYKGHGLFENTQTTVLNKVFLPDNDAFRTNVYTAFNIIANNSDEGSKKEYNEADYQNIISRKIRLLYVKQKTVGKIDYEECYKKNIKELEKTEVGKKILEKQNKDEQIAQKYLKVKDNDYKSKNEILISNIERGYSTIPQAINNNLSEFAHKACNIVNGIIALVKEKHEARITTKQIIKQLTNAKNSNSVDLLMKDNLHFKGLKGREEDILSK